jgi:tRNA(adenine34) deaminase
VITRDGEILGRAGNRRRELADPTAHAEVLAIREATARLGDFRLVGCTLYVTLEPCPMCTAVCRQSRLDLVIWGADDPKAGGCGSVIDLASDPRLGSALANRGGLESAACRELLLRFFAERRRGE